MKKYLKIILKDILGFLTTIIPILVLIAGFWLLINYERIAIILMIIITIGLYLWIVYERAKWQDD